MNKRLLLFSLLIGCAWLLPAQVIYSGQAELGWQGVDLRSVSTATNALGYPGLKNQFTGMQVGFYTFANRWVIGGKACGYMIQQPVIQGKLTLIRYYYGTLHVGGTLLDFHDKEKAFRLYPTAGLGYGAAYVRLDVGTSFKGYYAPGVISDVALNASWFRSMGGDPRHSLMLSLSGGYTQAFGGWTLRMTGAPEAQVGLTGLYVRAGLGMASAKR